MTSFEKCNKSIDDESTREGLLFGDNAPFLSCMTIAVKKTFTMQH